MRKPFIAGNWKMYLNAKTGVELAKAIAGGCKGAAGRDVLVCPAFPLLSEVAKAIEGSGVKLGAQNIYCEKEGAFTGTPAEVIDQAAEWRDHGLRYVVVCNVSAMQPNLRRGLAASVPFARILRGLRKL